LIVHGIHAPDMFTAMVGDLVWLSVEMESEEGARVSNV